jgi:hydroxymethylpyrimidine pyrophosphatase-like HAD family hydrolase
MHYLALATDYDGTLAQDGRVAESTVAALKRLRDSGRKLLLVTGREVPELRLVFPDLELCDAVVAENGAVLYWPQSGNEEVLGEVIPEAFLTEIARRGVEPFSAGRVIFSTLRPHEVVVLETIQALGLGHQIIFNKRSVMVLPSGITKASGLQRLLKKMEIDPAQVVGVGDAENDHAFLDCCGVAAAVDNAIQAVKDRCDLVLAEDHGRGVEQLIEQILDGDLQNLGSRRPRREIAERQIKAKLE